MGEIWKDIPGYEGYYMCSDFGRVYGKKNNIIRKIRKRKDGYRDIDLYKDGKIKRKLIHVLVAETFLSHLSDDLKIIVDHINNRREDNVLSNLQIVDRYINNSKDIDKTKTSTKFIGVHKKTHTTKYSAQIKINNKAIHLGMFETPEEGEKIYKLALINLTKYESPKQFRDFLKKRKQ